MKQRGLCALSSCKVGALRHLPAGGETVRQALRVAQAIRSHAENRRYSLSHACGGQKTAMPSSDVPCLKTLPPLPDRGAVVKLGQTASLEHRPASGIVFVSFVRFSCSSRVCSVRSTSSSNCLKALDVPFFIAFPVAFPSKVKLTRRY